MRRVFLKRPSIDFIMKCNQERNPALSAYASAIVDEKISGELCTHSVFLCVFHCFHTLVFRQKASIDFIMKYITSNDG